MIHYAFIVSTWLIGILGVGGAIAAIAGVVLLGPAAVTAIVQPVLSRFLACTWCVVTVVFVLATTGAYWVGHHESASECRAAELAAELRNKNIDLTNAQKAKDDETKRADAIEESASDQRKEDLAAIAALKARGHTCPFDDIDAGGVPARSGGTRNAKPAAAPGATGESPAVAAPHGLLRLPMVRRLGL